jgi:P27 family predicted phage terminase small subunit
MAGRPRKPTQLALLHGDDKKNPKRINRQEPKPLAGDIAPTEPLDAAARETWDLLAPDLIRQGVLTAWDCPAFTKYCQATSYYRQAVAGLRETGLVVLGSTGSPVKSPYWLIMNDALAMEIKLGAQFGLTPVDRAKIRIGGDKRDPGADLLSG